MRAAWDWHLPRASRAEQEAAVDFAQDLGFDTLIVSGPTPAMSERGRRVGIRVVAVIGAGADSEFARRHPDDIQQIAPWERAIEEATAGVGSEEHHTLAHQWFPLILGGPKVCFESERGRDYLRERAVRTLHDTGADGIALDGFGFKNGYSCRCERCTTRRDTAQKADPHRHPADILAETSRDSLLAVTRMIRDEVKDSKPDALLTNHIWPPFRPDPYYGARLHLDYCTQTISWFYRPVWSIERVELEASEHRRLENQRFNTFVPFIGLYADPPFLRSAERLERELEIALRYGRGSVALCTLAAPHRHPDIAQTVRAALARAVTPGTEGDSGA